jgi:hypothetical protein
MRGLLLNPIAVAFTAACGVGVCLALGWNPHVRELVVAAAIGLIACELALLPVVLARHANQLVMSQAALIGSMIHLFIAGAGAAVVLLGHLPLGRSCMIWLMVFYAASLIALAGSFIAAVKSAPPASAADAGSSIRPG